MDDEQKRLLLELIEARYENGGLIITSQLPIEQWYEYLNDPLIADAMLDRLIHKAEKITMSPNTPSMRKLQAIASGEADPTP